LRFEDNAQIYFDSSVRTEAMNLLTRTLIDPSSPSSAKAAANLLETLRSSRWHTTQELAWSLLALSDYYSFHKDEGEAKLEITNADGGALSSGGENVLVFPEERDISQLSVSNEGTGTGYVAWTCDGVPSSKPDPEDSGMKVSVAYYDSRGYPIDEASPVLAGEKVTGEITVHPLSKDLNNLVIALPLAGGLEIENPSFLNEAQIEYNYGYDPYFTTRTEMRDDRLLLFVERISKTYKWRFTVRAVTPGSFILPPVAAEEMYSPGTRSVGETSRIIIK
jgi:uncharacterized protein YfaS (alpha-2-macroglobulin family)